MEPGRSGEGGEEGGEIMKIIWTDNFGRSGETPGLDEKFIAQKCNEHYAKRIAQLLNDAEDINCPNYYRAVDDDYELQTFIP